MIQQHVLSDFTSRCGAFPPETPVHVERFGLPDATTVALVVPVHNQQPIIKDVLTRLADRAENAHEFIIVVDGCTDGSQEEVIAWASEQTFDGSTRRVVVAEIPDGVFETMSDVVGISLSSSEWIIEVQADVFMEEWGFDSLLIGALRQLPGVFCLSGRGAHRAAAARRSPISLLRGAGTAIAEPILARARTYRPSDLEYRATDRIGRCGELIDKPLDAPSHVSVYLHDTVMRGPIAFSAAVYRSLDGFDTDHFFLGDDDHDLFARAYAMKQLRVGHLPLRFSSPLALGSTRRERTPSEKRRFTDLRAHYEAAAVASFLRSGRVSADLPRRHQRVRIDRRVQQ